MKLSKMKTRFLSIGLVLASASALVFTGCKSSGEGEVQRYAWPLATASPEDTVTQIFLKSLPRKYHGSAMEK